MKLIIPFLLICHSIFAQQIFLKPDTLTNKFSYSEVIPTAAKFSDTVLLEAVKDWASMSTNTLYHFPANQVEASGWNTTSYWKLEDFARLESTFKSVPTVRSTTDSRKRIVVAGIFKYSDKGMSCLQVCYTHFNLILEVKQGKVRATLTNYEMDIYYHSTASTSDKSNKTLEQWILGKEYEDSKLCKKRTSEYTILLQEHGFAVLQSLKSYLNTLQADTSNW